ncbi:hypothetical protein, partial [Neorhizobium huautlense]|uniref:hypothetical protein n=1 Tax=Neorhizobium huautlense TaxID=67774 RepID=UPI0027D8B15C
SLPHSNAAGKPGGSHKTKPRQKMTGFVSSLRHGCRSSHASKPEKTTPVFYCCAVSCHTARLDVLQIAKAPGRLMVPLVVLRFSTMKLMMLGLQ